MLRATRPYSARSSATPRMTSDTPLIASRPATSFSTPYRDSVKCADCRLTTRDHQWQQRRGGDEHRCLDQPGAEKDTRMNTLISTRIDDVARNAVLS